MTDTQAESESIHIVWINKLFRDWLFYSWNLFAKAALTGIPLCAPLHFARHSHQIHHLFVIHQITHSMATPMSQNIAIWNPKRDWPPVVLFVTAVSAPDRAYFNGKLMHF